MLKTATVLLGSNVGVAVLKMLRNVLLARLLSVENYGVASTFAVIFALFEMLGYLGLDRLMVQTGAPDIPRVQATLQSMQVLRGVLGAALLFATADLMARIMGVPDIVWAFQLMAIVPLLQGFTHMDMSRMERTFNFGPFIRVQLGTEVAVILAIYPLFLVFGDYRVALFASLLQYALRLGLTHAFATERYRLGFDRGIAAHAFRFGGPILLNTLLLFAIFQGDRMIVANRLDLTDLAVFSLAFMLTLMPANVLAQTQQRLFLPKLAPMQDRPEAFARHARIAIESGLLHRPPGRGRLRPVRTGSRADLFGHKYDAALVPLIWLGVMHAVRIAKSGASVVALARGETWNQAVANLARVLTLPLAFLAVSHGAGLLAVIWIAIAGESLGLIVAFYLLRRLIGLPLHGLGVPFLLWGLCLGAICVYTVVYPPRPEIFGNFHSAQLILVAPLLAAFLACRICATTCSRACGGRPRAHFNAIHPIRIRKGQALAVRDAGERTDS